MKKAKIFGILILSIGLLIVGLSLHRIRWVFSLTRPEGQFPLELKWQIDLGHSTYERPTYQDGIVFFPARGIASLWYGVEARTGQIAWSKIIAPHSFLRCLTAEYLVLSGSTSLVVLEPKTGQVIWEGEQAATADCSENTVFFSGVPRDTIRAVELASGQLLWSGTTPRKSFYGLIYNPGTQELIAKETVLPGNMYIIEVESGVLKRSFDKVVYAPNDNGVGRGPMYLVDQNELFLGGTVLDANTGQVIHNEERYLSSTAPTVTADSIYLSSPQTGIVAFDRATYKVKWVYQPQPLAPLIPLAPVAIFNKVGYTIFSDATLGALDLETGQEVGYWQLEPSELWWWPICSFPPVLCNDSARAGLTASEDTLFVSFGDGNLYAFGE